MPSMVVFAHNLTKPLPTHEHTTDTHKHAETDTHKHTETDTHTDTYRHRYTYIHTLTDTHRDRHTDRQAHTHTDSPAALKCLCLILSLKHTEQNSEKYK